jgi:hypothetical protein
MLEVSVRSWLAVAYAQVGLTDTAIHSSRLTNNMMAPFAQVFAIVTSILLLGTVNGEYGTETPICSRTTDITTLGRCLETVVYAVRIVLNASDDFDSACDDLDYGRAADAGLDVTFLQTLVCLSFGGQGQFYGNTDDAIEHLALAKVALQVASYEPTNLALRYICPGLNLDMYQKFQLPADTIYDAACSDLYIPRPTISVSSSSVSSTTSQLSGYSTASSSSLTTPPTYPTNLTSSTSGYTSTSCTASSTSASIYRRQAAGSLEIDGWIKVIDSALFALTLIETNQDDDRCEVDDYWVDQWDSMGYLGDYVQALM